MSAGGGGGGAYVSKTYQRGEIIPGTILSLFVGSGGAGGVSTGSGGAGARGEIEVSWS